MRTLLLFALAACAAAVTLSPGVGARQSPASVAGPTASERALVAGSREAIIKTGVSADFFDRHFRLARVIDRPGDRRVVWLLAVGGHEATVNDSVGYYTEGGRRVDTHSVAATLPQTSDITRTITRRRAEALMRRCIGPFSNPQVEYRAHGDGGRAALLLTASRVMPPPPESRAARARREREEREARARSPQGGPQPQGDVVRSKGKAPGPVVKLGTVDLVTGECSVGYGQSGPLPPKEPPPARRH
ncbi:MAG TPA: hypothetical protein VF621_11610 [Pyrinomonadaceae bacterium]|jgi:hypothetical protein